ncbi:probable WRKY transcription factor 7 [Nicotiana sylvestris]|uniref:Probable WRKY transcription factor 7 n=1 Tax=Nicotiana sylvestris TaxID=4096 RepID=A0A1U7VJB5_NICSY|nr:PREDICTED: probable WRKY transcription factor 7 [Nicotiana sylvestris]
MKLICLLSQSHQNQQQQQRLDQNSSVSADYTAVADIVVIKFKKFISLLDKNRTGHARFRKGPISTPLPPPKPQQQRLDQNYIKIHNLQIEEIEKPQTNIPEIYCPTPIQHLPPLPHNHIQLVKNGSIERKESSTTINFPSASPANLFMSSLTGETESLQQSLSSGFQITNISTVF